MLNRFVFVFLAGSILSLFGACSPKPYAATNKSYKKQARAYAKIIRQAPLITPGADSLMMGETWVGTTNFNMRKPNYVIIHHTAQNATEQTLKTFTLPRTQVSAHYVIGRDGKIYHMLHDYLRAWHGGAARWGNNTDINSSSIGIELDNNGLEPFSSSQITSLLKVLAVLKKTHSIPEANFIGHSDIAPTRKNDPNALFPWQQLAKNGFGLWYDSAALVIPVTPVTPDSTQLAAPVIIADTTTSLTNASISDPFAVPAHFNPIDGLRIIGYDVQNEPAAIKAFKLHFIQKEVNAVLTESDKQVLYNLYIKYR